MFIVGVKKEDVLEEFSFINDWISVIEENIIKGKINMDKIDFYYSYGFFLPKIEENNREEFYTNLYEKSSKMLFDERLEFELSKVRVNITMKSGNFAMSNRMDKAYMPNLIKLIVTEVTKVKMIIEGNLHQNKDVIDSIPEIDNSIISVEFVKEVINKDFSDNDNVFDIDIILDKISQSGIDSLTEEEKEFLDKKSKNL